VGDVAAEWRDVSRVRRPDDPRVARRELLLDESESRGSRHRRGGRIRAVRRPPPWWRSRG